MSSADKYRNKTFNHANKNRGVRGFTIIELIVVIGILSGGIVAVQTAIQYGLRNAVVVSDGIVAAHLAEEGLELIRNVRDGNWAIRQFQQPTPTADTWDELSTGYYRLDYLLSNGFSRLYSGAPATCQDGQVLNFDSTSGLYSYAGGTFSKFRRVVNITNNTTYIEVSSQVCWTDSIGPHEIIITERLYDWRPE